MLAHLFSELSNKHEEARRSYRGCRDSTREWGGIERAARRQSVEDKVRAAHLNVTISVMHMQRRELIVPSGGSGIRGYTPVPPGCRCPCTVGGSGGVATGRDVVLVRSLSVARDRQKAGEREGRRWMREGIKERRVAAERRREGEVVRDRRFGQLQSVRASGPGRTSVRSFVRSFVRSLVRKVGDYDRINKGALDLRVGRERPAVVVIARTVPVHRRDDEQCVKILIHQTIVVLPSHSSVNRPAFSSKRLLYYNCHTVSLFFSFVPTLPPPRPHPPALPTLQPFLFLPSAAHTRLPTPLPILILYLYLSRRMNHASILTHRRGVCGWYAENWAGSTYGFVTHTPLMRCHENCPCKSTVSRPYYGRLGCVPVVNATKNATTLPVFGKFFFRVKNATIDTQKNNLGSELRQENFHYSIQKTIND